MFLNRLCVLGVWLKRQVLHRRSLCPLRGGSAAEEEARYIVAWEGKGYYGTLPSISLSQTDPLLNRREVESQSGEHKDSFSDSSSCVYIETTDTYQQNPREYVILPRRRITRTRTLDS